MRHPKPQTTIHIAQLTSANVEYVRLSVLRWIRRANQHDSRADTGFAKPNIFLTAFRWNLFV